LPPRAPKKRRAARDKHLRRAARRPGQPDLGVCIEPGIADTLGKPALLIGTAGTEAELANRIPSLAKRRCHPYTRSDDLAPVLARFFAGELTWA
jgi:hypothetical protein